jgi:hypothetical protein
LPGTHTLREICTHIDTHIHTHRERERERETYTHTEREIHTHTQTHTHSLTLWMCGHTAIMADRQLQRGWSVHLTDPRPAAWGPTKYVGAIHTYIYRERERERVSV